MANTTTYTLILNQAKAREFIMPDGYWPDVEIHCWGAGGGAGWGGSTGGGGGYAKVVTNVNAGDRIRLQIGQPGKSATSQEAGGAGGSDGTDTRFKGGNGGGKIADTQSKVLTYYDGSIGQLGLVGQPRTITVAGTGAYPSGGGGGASWVSINDSVVCVGAGGGGGGGAGGTSATQCYHTGNYGYNSLGGYVLPGGITVLGNYLGINNQYLSDTWCNNGGFGYVGYGIGGILNPIYSELPRVTGTKYNGNPGGVYPGVASTVYAVSNGAWSSFLNTYGVWGGGQDYSVAINFPVSGTYTFKYSVDNYGSISLDGSPVITRTGENNFQTFYTQTVSVTSGVHTVRLVGVNISGPAGVGAQILNPDTSELWNSRSLLVTSGLTSNSQGGNAVYGGGGGGGYLGGRPGTASSLSVTGGNGGLNYGSTTDPGTGTFPGGRSGYYPGNKVGEAGYPGYIVIVLRKKLNAFIKNPDSSGDWVGIESSYVKVPTQTVYATRVLPPETIKFESKGVSTWTVPVGVTSISVIANGGAGGGGGGDAGKNYNGNGVGGGGANRKTQTIAVTPGQKLTITVGAGGAGGPVGGDGIDGTPSSITGTGVSFTTGAGTHGGGYYTGRETGIGADGANNGNNALFGGAGGTSTNGGANGGAGGGFKRAGGIGGGGKVYITYQPLPEQITVTTGGWKQIQQAFIKVNGEWKPILTDSEIVLYTY